MEGRVDHGRGVTGPPGPAGPALALRVPGGAAAGSRPCRTELPLGPLLGRGPSGRPGDAPAVPAGPLRKAPVRVPRVRHPCGPRGASSCVSAPHRAADAGRPAGPAPARGLCPGTCCSRCGPHTASASCHPKPVRSPASRAAARHHGPEPENPRGCVGFTGTLGSEEPRPRKQLRIPFGPAMTLFWGFALQRGRCTAKPPRFRAPGGERWLPFLPRLGPQ